MGNIFSAIGLCLDIIGVYLLFKFGVAGDSSNTQIFESKIDDFEMDFKIKNWLAKTAFRLILLGFAFQLLGLFFSRSNPQNNAQTKTENKK
jgi:hypothetical protein